MSDQSAATPTDGSPARGIRTQLNADVICAHLEDGPIDGLAGICRALGLSVSGVYQWINNDADFAAQIEAARQIGIDTIQERTRRVARGEAGYSSGDTKRDKLIIDQDNKLASKWHPKRYGDKLEVEQVTRSVNLELPADISAEEAARRYAELTKGS